MPLLIEQDMIDDLRGGACGASHRSSDGELLCVWCSQFVKEGLPVILVRLRHGWEILDRVDAHLRAHQLLAVAR